jgi:ATP-binding cassette subfamily B protein
VQAKQDRPETSDVSEPGKAGSQDGGRSRSLGPLAALGPHLWRHKAMLVIAAVALIASALAMLSVPLAFRQIIDQGFAGGDGGSIDRAFLTLIAIGAVLAVASSIRFYAVSWLGERVVADIRADLFRHLTTLGPGFFDKTHSGEIMSRLSADTTQVKAAAGTAISQAVRNLIMLVGALTMMLVTSPRLSVLVLVAIPLIVLPLVAYGRVVRRLSRRAQDTLADASAYAAENLSAWRTMQAFTHEKAVAGRFDRAIGLAFQSARDRLRARAVLTAMVILLAVGGVASVLWYGAGLVARGEMTGGTLGQFVLYALFAAGALAELSEVWGEVQQAAGAAERLAELAAIRPDIVSPVVPRSLPVTPDDRPAGGTAPRSVAAPGPRSGLGRIEFRHVGFGYRGADGAVALDDVSFTVAPGERVAIVGPSGAGKSTVLALLLRFYDPDRGSILLDGVPITEASLDEVRRHIAVVPQEPALFADTVTENIRYGSPDATLERVRAAAMAAHADAFIRELPQGYDTVLGERGVSLSGGQRQRIAIARAILKDAPVLALDEATSALDAESEVAVQRALEAARGRTTLVIAHRLATVQHADRILMLDRGKLVEQGRHAELVARGGLYARLARLQFGVGEAAQ